eukprot:3815664-Pyramimonas_sp.AAC.1
MVLVPGPKPCASFHPSQSSGVHPHLNDRLFARQYFMYRVTALLVIYNPDCTPWLVHIVYRVTSLRVQSLWARYHYLWSSSVCQVCPMMSHVVLKTLEQVSATMNIIIQPDLLSLPPPMFTCSYVSRCDINLWQFGNIFAGQRQYYNTLDRLYKEREASWFTPVEIFRPWCVGSIY